MSYCLVVGFFRPCEIEKGACSFPSAHVQLTKKQQLLMIGQRYKIFLSLEMPESPANVDLGKSFIFTLFIYLQYKLFLQTSFRW